MAQMKEQNKTPEKELNKMETSNPPDAEFKALVIRMLNKLSDIFNNIKKDQSEMKNTLTEMKNDLQRINSRVDEAKNPISDLEYKEAKSTQSEQQKEKRIQENKDSGRSPWDNFKNTEIPIKGRPEGEEKEKKTENLFNDKKIT